MPLLDHFGILAPFYEQLLPLRNPEQFIELAGLPAEGALLDVGGGTGRVAQVLRRWINRVVLVDESAGMVRQAKEKNGLCVVRTPAESLPFSNESFSRVIMVDTLHHVRSQLETARELWRVLKPGGKIVIEEPDIRTMIVKFVAVAEKVALMRSHFYSPGQIQAFFSYPNARTRVESEGFNAWIIVDKLS